MNNISTPADLSRLFLFSVFLKKTKPKNTQFQHGKFFLPFLLLALGSASGRPEKTSGWPSA